MAGHSKWANTKHRKERADAKKGKLFTRVTKEIINAVKSGGADPKANAKLRAAIAKAKEANLPSENIERNIKKAQSSDQSSFHDFVYELYGHGGVGIIASGMTDNKNRLASEMRIATNKRGGSVATPGAVSFNFVHSAIFTLDYDVAGQEQLFLLASDLGAEDILFEERASIIAPADSFASLSQGLRDAGYSLSSEELTFLPKAEVSCSDDDCRANLALIEWLETIDDVDEVVHNMEQA